MKKIAICLLILLLAAGCSQAKAERDTDLETEIQNIAAENTDKEIDLASLIDFDWEKAYLFTPYMPPESINKELGFKFKDPSGIEHRDDICLLVFTNQDKVVQYAELSRVASYNFGDKEYLTPSDATLYFSREP